VHAIVAAGYEVHVYPINGAPYDLMSLFGDFPDGVEILHDRDFLNLPEFLGERRDVYDLIWVARTHNLARILPLLCKAGMDPAHVPVILDTEAVAAARDAARAALNGQTFDFEAALRAEFSEAQVCTRILAVNENEAGLLRELDFTRPVLLGTARRAAPTQASFAARSGLLFVTATHQADSPGLDSLRWYLEQILPALAAELGEAPVLNVVGYTAPEIDLSAFAKDKRIKLHGPVGDLMPFYNAARVFIAPTRFAAGTPYKIYEAASFGLPCVATNLLIGQLGWAEGNEIFGAAVGDAHGFARQVALLYRGEGAWSDIRANALARLEMENGVEAFNARVAEILDLAS
jgi:O-antigen biosynthesis protein